MAHLIISATEIKRVHGIRKSIPIQCHVQRHQQQQFVAYHKKQQTLMHRKYASGTKITVATATQKELRDFSSQDNSSNWGKPENRAVLDTRLQNHIITTRVYNALG